MSEPVSSPEEQAVQPRPAPRPRRSKRRTSVYSYVLILFVAAFFLLALSYFMQQRTMAESLDGLKESVSAMEKAETLQTENMTLKEQVEALEAEKAALNAENARLTQERDAALAAAEAQSRTAEAMDWFWQINEAYARNRNQTARRLIEQMDDALVDFLPQESATDTDRFSPRDRYQEIYDALY